MKNKRVLWMVAALFVVWAGVGFARNTDAQGVVSLRDEQNGYLCFDFRAWGQCFAFTDTPAPVVTSVSTATPSHAPTDTLAPSATAYHSATPTYTPAATHTATLLPSATVTRAPTLAPSATAVVARLVNGDFESITNGNPTGWDKVVWYGAADWKSEVSPPGDMLAIYNGNGSVRFLGHPIQPSLTCYRAGVAQTLDAPAGRTITVGAWFLTLGSGESGLHNADPNMNSELGIGIDKYATGDVGSGDVVWKFAAGENLRGPLIGGNWEPVWTYHAQTVRVPADSTRITVYLTVDLGRTREGKCNWALPQTLGFIDSASIQVLP